MKSISRSNLNTITRHPAMETLAGLSFVPGFNYDVAGFAGFIADARILDMDLGKNKNRWLRS